MRMYDLIMKKRNGAALDAEEIDYMIREYTADKIPDYQMAAMMMAVYFRGMTKEETAALTMAMAHSGDMLDLSAVEGVKADKHSTGGVGDKTSIALMPMVAACGLKIAKMSGRGLGHTGGTIDKLESFPGFSTGISTAQFMEQVNRIGISIMGQTLSLAPADKKLYALRDVTATVDNLSLIASSIMSKKLASGADAIVLDVKTGSGAFMKKEEDAFALAREMVMVGNALEVKEAIETLRGNGPEDFLTLCMTLGTQMLLAGGKAETEAQAEAMLRKVIEDGSALRKLAQFVEAQGGDAAAVYDTSLLPQAEIVEEVYAREEGCLTRMVCDEIGTCALMLGGGRETKDSEIDLSVGIVLHKKVGDYVKKGDALAAIYANDAGKLAAARERFLKACYFGEKAPDAGKFIKGIVR